MILAGSVDVMLPESASNQRHGLWPCSMHNDARLAARCPENFVVVVDDVGGKDRQDHEHLVPHRSLTSGTGDLLRMLMYSSGMNRRILNTRTRKV